MTQPHSDTEPDGPTARYATAADLARSLATEAGSTDPTGRFGKAFAELLDALGAEHLRLGALPPRVRLRGVDTAAAFLAMHRVDQQNSDTIEAAALAGDPFTGALRTMRRNELVSPPGTAPRALAASFVDLLEHALDPETELDAEMHARLRSLAAAVVAVANADEAELDELDELGPGEFQIGVFADGSIAAGRVADATPITRTGKSNMFGLLIAREGDDIKHGRDLAVTSGVAVSEDSTRFRLRTGPLDPARVDVYDEQGERTAIITEVGTDWRCVMISNRGGETAEASSFAGAVEHVDRFLAEGPR